MRVRPQGTFGLQYIYVIMICICQKTPAAGQWLPSEDVGEGSSVLATYQIGLNTSIWNIFGRSWRFPIHIPQFEGHLEFDT